MSKHPPSGNLPVEPPLTLDSPDAENWDAECDLLVVGLGAAGAATAIAAREAGANVRVADRFGMGGATAKSGGIIYAGGGTPHQLKAGYEDTPQAMFDYLRLEVEDAVSEPTLRRFCDDSRDLLAWLESLGARYASNPNPPKTSYPPTGSYLYFSGNEPVAPFAQAAPPAPRGHRTITSGGPLGTGSELFRHLRARVDALGIPVMAPASVRRLIQDGNGMVIGAEAWQLEPGSRAARKHRRLIRIAETIHNFAGPLADRLRARALAIELSQARPLRVRTRRGVTLTTGGFVFNRDMVREYAPKYAANMRLGATGCDGSGIRLGQSVGAADGRLHKASSWRFINPPTAWARGIVVDAQGQRFCNEASYGARLGVAMCEDHGGRAWLILDRKTRRAAIKECFFGGLWGFQKYPALALMLLFPPRGRTLAALAKRQGIPAQALADTVRQYNAAARGEAVDAVEKTAPNLQPLTTPPYYALDISATNPMFPCPTITLGGLRVSETDGAVLDRHGQRIAGLYAAGRAAVGIASNGYISGLSLADCLWSGRRAGAAAAAAPAVADSETTIA